MNIRSMGGSFEITKPSIHQRSVCSVVRRATTEGVSGAGDVEAGVRSDVTGVTGMAP